MNLIKKSLITSLIIGSAFSFVDGTTGSSSQGSINIDLNKGDQVRISSLADVDFGAVVSAPNDLFIDVCVYSTTGSYDITANSSNPNGNSFRLANAGATSFITYDLEFNNAASGVGGTDLNNAVTSGAFGNANTVADDCGGVDNARLFVEINAGSFNSAPSDAYSDVLTLVVTPR